MSDEPRVGSSIDAEAAKEMEAPAEPSEEEKNAAKADANRLLETKEVQRLFRTMVTSRYIYYLARVELVKSLEKNKANSLTEGVLVAAAGKYSENPTTVRQICNEVTNVVAPFLYETLAITEGEQKDAQVADDRAAEDARRKLPVTIGDMKFAKGRITAVVGGCVLIPHMMDHIQQKVDPPNIRIIRIGSSKRLPPEQDNVAYIPAQAFRDCANSAEAFLDRLLKYTMSSFKSKQLDLVLIDDLMTIFSETLMGRSTPRAAAIAQKNLKKGLTEVGAACVFGLSSGEVFPEALDPGDITWGELTKYCQLLKLTSEPDDEGHTLKCGSLEHHVEKKVWVDDLIAGSKFNL